MAEVRVLTGARCPRCRQQTSDRKGTNPTSGAGRWYCEKCDFTFEVQSFRASRLTTLVQK